MEPFIIFKCLKDKKALKSFVNSALLIAAIYVGFSIALSLITTKPFPKGPLLQVIQFGGLKAFAGFLMLDWVVFFGFILVGALLFANYGYWKCPSKTTGHVGLMAGLVTATCPACILPVLGITSFAAGVSTATLFIKIGLLGGLLVATYLVVYKQKSCKITK